MRFVGILLIVFGGAVIANGGLHYTQSRHSTDIGPVQVSTARKGLITPATAAVAALVGVVLVAAGRREAV